MLFVYSSLGRAAGGKGALAKIRELDDRLLARPGDAVGEMALLPRNRKVADRSRSSDLKGRGRRGRAEAAPLQNTAQSATTSNSERPAMVSLFLVIISTALIYQFFLASFGFIAACSE